MSLCAILSVLIVVCLYLLYIPVTLRSDFKVLCCWTSLGHLCYYLPCVQIHRVKFYLKYSL